MNLDLGASADLLVGRAASWSLVAGPRCLANGWGPDLVCSTEGSGLLVGGLDGHRLWDCSFLVACVCPLVGGAGLKSSANSLMARAEESRILGLVLAHWR